MTHKATTAYWKGAKRIRDILVQKKATWTELKQETELSHNVLSKYLRDLQDEHLVFRGKIDGKYSTYERAEQSFAHDLDNTLVLSDQLLFVKDLLKLDPSMKDADGFLEKAIRAGVTSLAASMPAFIYNSLRSNRIVDPRVGDLSALSMDEMIDIFIRPWIHNLVELCLLDRESGERITVETSDSIFGAALKEYDEYLETLNKLL
jgi:hypothetical protein